MLSKNLLELQKVKIANIIIKLKKKKKKKLNIQKVKIMAAGPITSRQIDG